MNWTGGAAQRTYRGRTGTIVRGRGGIRRNFNLDVERGPAQGTLTQETDRNKRFSNVVELAKYLPGGHALFLQLSHQMEIDRAIPAVSSGTTSEQ